MYMTAQSFSGEHRENTAYFERLVLALRHSFFLSIAVFGLSLIGLGYTLEMLATIGYPVENGIIAGMLAIWGTTSLVLGCVGYGGLRYLRNY